MSTLKITSVLSKFLTARGTTTSSAAGSPRAFVTATSRPLQAKRDEDTAEACKGVTEAAESVKEGARSVKNAAETVTNMTKEVTKKVSETAETITDKAASVIKDKIGGM
ncbi:hypothetical protein NC652_000641 [Populus alba x Populus x berolinensis]|uniref:Uncharacterized protein n=3 Tax=Populus TaxID=3689 RepID=A0A4U5NB19_POPAL|nr:uncharacterized protein LOC118061761 [Populus alba]KAG6791300.1 hypothetical protein POTOM_000416 [Populus tomentosa]KAJ6961757.1 hypothetical protein NC652_000641 [Populus alba x Populus x berolinensis]TKR79712.1 hypothetical protein D5086_0000269740 [Populus alba]